MEETTQTPLQAPTTAQKMNRQQILHGICILVIAVGFLIMIMRETLLDVPYARSGVAVLTAIALVGFYLTGEKKSNA